MKNQSLKNITTFAVIIGLLDSIYLTIEKVTNNKAMCLPGLGDCWTVSNSPYSMIFGIPVAVLGIFAYSALLVLLKLEEISPNRKEFFIQAGLGIALSGTIYSIYLTYLEIAVIKAVCPFCVISAIVMVVLLIITSVRLVKYQGEFKPQLEDKNG